MKKKILLLLLAGVALGFAYSPKQQRKVLKEIGREWKTINQEKLKREIHSLYKADLIAIEQGADGSHTYILSRQGKLKALSYRFENMKIPKHKWDKKWRLVSFDIPEDYRHARDALRQKLRQIGFSELQKSVFVVPYECKNEIKFLTDFFEVGKYVRYGVLESIDNDRDLRKIFHLL
ncbi:MAG: CRISPR-associated endonuclease Cas2 [Patescibacteria group bacterium]